MKKDLAKVDMSLLPEKTHTDWVNLDKQLKISLDKIESEDNLKTQRKAFASLSQAMYKIIKAFGMGEEVYYQYCPMALEGEGAYWLSNSKSIKNPYLGNNMLTCGSIKETIQSLNP
jgi:membrane fusion protein, copper/silver efflux system